jgi:hypothetical protein
LFRSAYLRDLLADEVKIGSISVSAVVSGFAKYPHEPGIPQPGSGTLESFLMSARAAVEFPNTVRLLFRGVLVGFLAEQYGLSQYEKPEIAVTGLQVGMPE